ncbi:BA75_04916T0 [Komagataella pastoris]|uniref:BA75_04916T0 n=1 Tax=Komagataella pastoris TaxID=4922 RepID=A0A1B2JIM0_PICPA|nr:BA75_04916T0 [Komagataella pastoris]
MRGLKFIFMALAAAVAQGISDNSQWSNEHVVASLSLPDLDLTTSMKNLKDWKLNGDVKLDQGRIILTPKPKIVSLNDEKKQIKGSIWTEYGFGLNQFTIEVTMRSLGSIGKTASGFSLWLVDDQADSISKDPGNNFGGPDKYKGLQVLMDSNDAKLNSVTRSYLMDGDFDISKAFSICNFPYQNSNVPVILRLSYKKGNFKLTIDNKLCFQTDKITIPLGRFWTFGISAATRNDLKVHEQFEILKLKTYNDVVDSDDEVDLLLDQPYATTTILEQTSKATKAPESKTIASEYGNSQAFREKELELKNQLAQQKSAEALPYIIAKLDTLESLVDETNLLITSSNEQPHGDILLQQINRQFHEVFKQIGYLNDKIELLSRSPDSSSSSSTSSDLGGLKRDILALTETVKGLSEEQKTVMQALLRINDLVKTPNHANVVTLDEVASKMKMYLAPLLLIFIIIIVMNYRLGKQIRHAKIL